MKILIVSQWCFPEPDARILNMAEDLLEDGHKVEILTGFPNYPGGKIYPGYKLGLFKREIISGVKINRVYLYPSHDKSSKKRIINYCSFAVSASILGVFLVKKPDIIYVYHPPATAAIPAIFLKTIFRSKLVYDIQDLWPDSIAATGMIKKDWIINLINRFQNYVYSKADAITVISRGFKNILKKRNIADEKIHVIRNWSIPMGSGNGIDNNVNFGNRFNILFAGAHGSAQSLDTIINAAQILWEDGERDIQFVFLGTGPLKEELMMLAKSKNIGNVLFIDRVNPNQVTNYLLAADVLLVHLKDEPLFSITIPSKIQSYMMVGKPILAGVSGDAADLINEAKAGIVFEPQQANDLIEKVKIFKNMTNRELLEMGENGKKYYTNNLSREVGSSRFLSLFKLLLK